jgi:GST-like protein
MIELKYRPAPDAHMITIFLEETDLPYRLLPVTLEERMPAIVDLSPLDGGAPVAVCESGAILVYLAQKMEQFIPASVRGSAEVLEWLFWQASGLGPASGRKNHKETARLYGVLNGRLADREFVAGEYSIADMAAYPFVVPHAGRRREMTDFPHLQRWFEAIKSRPATARAYALAAP